MKYAVEMTSGGIIYILSRIGSYAWLIITGSGLGDRIYWHFYYNYS
jgi:hypothetical protein